MTVEKNSQDIVEIIQNLKADDIIERIKMLQEHERILRTLLRSARAKERAIRERSGKK